MFLDNVSQASSYHSLPEPQYRTDRRATSILQNRHMVGTSHFLGQAKQGHGALQNATTVKTVLKATPLNSTPLF